jgi:hypothetical protein
MEDGDNGERGQGTRRNEAKGKKNKISIFPLGGQAVALLTKMASSTRTG